MNRSGLWRKGALVLFVFIVILIPLLCLQGVTGADNGVVPRFLLGWDPTIQTDPIYREYDDGWGGESTTLPAGMSVSGNFNEVYYEIVIPNSYLGGNGATFYWAINVEADWDSTSGSQMHHFPYGWVRWTGTGCHQDSVSSAAESWNESDFEHLGTVFGIDLTRECVDDDCLWTITLNEAPIPGHTMTGVQLMIAEDTSTNGDGCFIATAAYGTSTAEEIDTLRAFRDEVLLQNSLGSQLVDLYYEVSPPVADFISEYEPLRTLVRELLVDPVAWLVEATGTLWRD